MTWVQALSPWTWVFIAFFRYNFNNADGNRNFARRCNVVFLQAIASIHFDLCVPRGNLLNSWNWFGHVYWLWFNQYSWPIQRCWKVSWLVCKCSSYWCFMLTFRFSLQTGCNQNCDCSTRVYTPICGPDSKTTYFSPCYAGCSQYNPLNSVCVFFPICSIHFVWVYLKC